MIERRELPAIAALSAAVVAVFSPLLFHLIVGSGPRIDYFQHVELARTMASDFTLRTPHFLFQLLVIAVEKVVGDFWRAGFVVVIASYVILALVLYFELRRSAPTALGLMLASPLSLLAGLDGHYYFGYISGAIYHNPTIVLLKPLTILLFVWSARFFLSPFRASVRVITLIAIVVMLSAIAKPSYLICLLPALAVVALLRVVRRQPVDWRALLLGVVLPSMLLLGWQYLHTYTGNGSKSSVAFAPFLVARHYSDWLLPKFLLSIAFPLVVTIVFFRRALADIRLGLAWLGAALGAFYFYCLIETGDLTFHGNFGWSGVIAFFVLFFAATAFLLDQWRLHPEEKWPLILSTAVFCLHVISGMIWYVLSWQGRTFW